MNANVRVVEDFNMEDFGFEMVGLSRGGRSPKLHDKDYIINSVSTYNGSRYTVPIISLSRYTWESVTELLGDTVDVGINGKGYICLQPGTKRKVSTAHKGNRACISIGCLRDKLEAIYGEYKRIYVTVQPYGNFNAVIIKPTGERDDK